MALKRTSSGPSLGSSGGPCEAVAIWNECEYWDGATKFGKWSKGLLTVAACFDIAGFNILALRGILDEGDRESLLNGLYAVEQQGRKNINGSSADITVLLTWYDCVNSQYFSLTPRRWGPYLLCFGAGLGLGMNRTSHEETFLLECFI